MVASQAIFGENGNCPPVEPDELMIESPMPAAGVVFSDGVEQDFLPFNSGAIVRIQVSQQRANLVTK